MIWWAWLIVGSLLLLLELVASSGLFLLFFGIGAFGVGLFSLLTLNGYPIVQWILLPVLSSLLLAFFRRPLLGYFQQNRSHPRVQDVIGEIATALEEIPVNAVGKAEFRGSPWTVRNVGGEPLRRSQRCTVAHIEGLTLWVHGDP